MYQNVEAPSFSRCLLVRMKQDCAEERLECDGWSARSNGMGGARVAVAFLRLTNQGERRGLTWMTREVSMPV